MKTAEFNEAYMSTDVMLKGSGVVGFGASNRTPSTSRVQATPAKSPKVPSKAPKGLSRACVLVVKEDPRTYKVFVKGSGALLGTVRSACGRKGKAYSYKLTTEARSHSGFPSQAAAVRRMLEKV